MCLGPKCDLSFLGNCLIHLLLEFFFFLFWKLLGTFCLSLTYFIISLGAAFQSMMSGGNIGKQIVSVSK